ncbi:luciferin sulfotransferase-like [Toxorhynchites rutilus septentrionalis]|uniref:luciferin sulfotransferase-like n=1 Tax=Toxorhynchites rutilus septentrionalis TaxID=329112 RepID=UPI0024783A95|nr:luciferin sulfotransferase-like [Toxorhynchites rutilus septentrionalis]
MAFEYIEIVDPIYKATHQEREEQDYVLVRPTETSMIPITLPDWQPEPCCLNKKFEALAQRIKDMDVQLCDVWMVSYPKSGTTWCQEMIWLICNDLNYEKAAGSKLRERFPFLELGGLRELPKNVDCFQDVLSMQSPRFIKTHLPVAFLPDQIWTVKPRIIYVRRNPKAIAVSYYHHSVSLHGYKGTMEQFVHSFINELQYYSPYHRHVVEYHSLEYEDDILYLCYEEMKKDLKDTMKRVCKFFNKCYSEEQLDTLAQHLSFESMKDNKSVNSQEWVEYCLRKTNREDKIKDVNSQFIRRGEPDGWKQELSPELSLEIDGWTEKKVTDPDQIALFQYD